MSQPAIQCQGLTKTFGGVPVVQDVSLQIAPHSLLAVLGPSGCGKTTLLRLIAGFERPSAGTIWVGGRPVVGGGKFLPPEQRAVGMVFQDYALFPHLTVQKNVMFGLRHRRTGRERAARLLDMVGLAGCEDRLPAELSGGEQQRVALARALAAEPEVLLLDEPFSNLDAGLRLQMRRDLRTILNRAGVTALLVTHDQEEAFFLGERVAVMHAGRIEQIGAPEEIYHQPASAFVARFVGQADLLQGTVVGTQVQTAAGTLRPRDAAAAGAARPHVEVVIRPDDVALDAAVDADSEIVGRAFQGTHYLYRVRLASGEVIHALGPHTMTLAEGARVRVRLDPGHDLIAFVNGHAIHVEAP